jgi:hypothetical protein
MAWREFWSSIWIFFMLAALVFAGVGPSFIAFYHRLKWRWLVAAINIVPLVALVVALFLSASGVALFLGIVGVVGWFLALLIALIDFFT